MGGRQEADPPPECFAASRQHQRASQWARGKTNYQRNDWRVRRVPLPSLLQMDIIKPLAGKWGLMTPSGPILGLNKWWKIKLRSKLQLACSRTVYQQCATNQREKRRGGLLFHIHLLLFSCFCLLFVFYSMTEGLLSLRNLSSTLRLSCESFLRAILL